MRRTIRLMSVPDKRKTHPAYLKKPPTKKFLNQSLRSTNNAILHKAFGKKAMKNQQALPSGRCQKCGDHDDDLFPDVLRCCNKCLDKIKRNVNTLTIITHDHVPKWSRRQLPNCDICYKPSRMAWKINPFMCAKCIQLIGRRARLGKTGFYND